MVKSPYEKKSKETSNDALTVSPKNTFHYFTSSQGGSKTR